MIVIVTDSTACLTQQDARDLGVIYVPMTYSIEEDTRAEDYVDACGDFATRLHGVEQLSTSQASGHSFMRTFTSLRKEGYEILCLTLSARLSGTYNNAVACAKELGDTDIRVIDSLTTGAGLMILAVQARRLIDAGCTLDEAADMIQSMTKDVHMYFSVEDMDPLRKSGRLGPVRQSISTILNMRPILSCEEGRLVAKKMVRGNRERLKELVMAVPPDAVNVIITNFVSNSEEDFLYEALQQRCSCPIIVRMIGPTLAIHVGEGAVGVAWLEA